MTRIIRHATEADQETLTRLVREARLNPRGLAWPAFVVAEEAGNVIGAAQVRVHSDGAHELASLVVRPDHRGRGVAAAMVDALLEDGAGPTYAVLDRRHAPHFARWGFRPERPDALPRSVRRTYRTGRAVTAVLGLAAGRRIRLVPVVRP